MPSIDFLSITTLEQIEQNESTDNDGSGAVGVSPTGGSSIGGTSEGQSFDYNLDSSIEYGSYIAPDSIDSPYSPDHGSDVVFVIAEEQGDDSNKVLGQHEEFLPYRGVGQQTEYIDSFLQGQHNERLPSVTPYRNSQYQLLKDGYTVGHEAELPDRLIYQNTASLYIGGYHKNSQLTQLPVGPDDNGWTETFDEFEFEVVFRDEPHYISEGYAYKFKQIWATLKGVDQIPRDGQVISIQNKAEDNDRPTEFNHYEEDYTYYNRDTESALIEDSHNQNATYLLFKNAQFNPDSVDGSHLKLESLPYPEPEQIPFSPGNLTNREDYVVRYKDGSVERHFFKLPKSITADTFYVQLGELSRPPKNIRIYKSENLDESLVRQKLIAEAGDYLLRSDPPPYGYYHPKIPGTSVHYRQGARCYDTVKSSCVEYLIEDNHPLWEPRSNSPSQYVTQYGYSVAQFLEEDVYLYLDGNNTGPNQSVNSSYRGSSLAYLSEDSSILYLEGNNAPNDEETSVGYIGVTFEYLFEEQFYYTDPVSNSPVIAFPLYEGRGYNKSILIEPDDETALLYSNNPRDDFIFGYYIDCLPNEISYQYAPPNSVVKLGLVNENRLIVNGENKQTLNVSYYGQTTATLETGYFVGQHLELFENDFSYGAQTAYLPGVQRDQNTQTLTHSITNYHVTALKNAPLAKGQDSQNIPFEYFYDEQTPLKHTHFYKKENQEWLLRRGIQQVEARLFDSYTGWQDAYTFIWRVWGQNTDLVVTTPADFGEQKATLIDGFHVSNEVKLPGTYFAKNPNDQAFTETDFYKGAQSWQGVNTSFAKDSQSESIIETSIVKKRQTTYFASGEPVIGRHIEYLEKTKLLSNALIAFLPQGQITLGQQTNSFPETANFNGYCGILLNNSLSYVNAQIAELTNTYLAATQNDADLSQITIEALGGSKAALSESLAVKGWQLWQEVKTGIAQGAQTEQFANTYLAIDKNDAGLSETPTETFGEIKATLPGSINFNGSMTATLSESIISAGRSVIDLAYSRQTQGSQTSGFKQTEPALKQNTKKLPGTWLTSGQHEGLLEQAIIIANQNGQWALNASVNQQQIICDLPATQKGLKQLNQSLLSVEAARGISQTLLVMREMDRLTGGQMATLPIIDSTPIQYSTGASVFVEGKSIKIESINYRVDEGSSTYQFDLTLVDHEDYELFRIGTAFEVDLFNLEQFNLIVTARAVEREWGDTRVTIKAQSPAVQLTNDWAEKINVDHLEGAMAREIAENHLGQPIDWRVPNWFIPGGRLAFNETSPYEAAATIVEAVGGVLESKPNGTLIARAIWPVSIKDYNNHEPDIVLTDYDIEFLQERFEKTEIINRVLVVDITETNRDKLESNVEGMKGDIIAYPSPWRSVEIYKNTTAPLNMSNANETIQTHTEMVEIKAGSASLQYPIYSIVDVTWYSNPMGAINFAPYSNTIKTNKPGYGLAEITYKTKALAVSTESALEQTAQFLLIDKE